MRVGFIFVVVGFVVGLGNIWCFFYIVYENGGGVFFLLYLFVLLMIGILLLVFEFVFGYCYCGLVLFIFFCISLCVEFIGWW